MLWKLEHKSLHIIGSVHTADHPMVLREHLLKVIGKAEIVAFEANFDLPLDLRAGHYPQSKNLIKEIPPDLWADTRDAWLRAGFPEDDLARQRPWLVAFSLMNSKLQAQGFLQTHGIDRQLIEFAKQARKSLFFLETMTESLAPFRQAQHEEQLTFLSEIVRNEKQGILDVRYMVDSWESDDPNGFLPIREKSIRLMPKMYTAALAGRNKQWFSKLLRLANGDRQVVAVVGGLHMVGPDGLPAMFAAKGIACQHMAYAQLG